MGFFMFICNLIIPVAVILGGVFMSKNAPKNVNNIAGYRTPRSMKNSDTWKFANTYCGKLWIKIGVVLLIATVLVQLPFIKSTEEIVSDVTLILTTIQIVILLISIVPVERALKRTFDDEGRRIE